MNKEFVPYELAVKLKQLGFDEPCFAYYKDMKGEKVLLYDSMDFDGECNAPLYQQAFRWFREKYDLVGIVKFGTNDFTYNIYSDDGIGLLTKESLGFNGTYEEAELSCLTKLIKITEKHEN